ncbi:hypothetical protein [Ensifer adhaerens]|uniref:hypothetical protein n=1 Tax=Ensifer adhaerens TaxID=106592 RepID=UPI00098E9C38|nr:hypothetical protein [Ensifer adhaerens]
MSRTKTISLGDVLKDPLAFFAAAKSKGSQQVDDEDGSFTLIYQKKNGKPDAREFLARGARRD